MKTYYLFRHGETYFSKTETPYGEAELTTSILPEAKPVIEKLADFLKEKNIGYAMRSELLRCEETAKIIEERIGLHFETEALLNEFTEKDFDIFERRMEVLKEKLTILPESSIALCTHGAVVAGLKRLLLGKEFRAHDLMYYPKTGVIVKISEGKIEEIDFNSP